MSASATFSMLQVHMSSSVQKQMQNRWMNMYRCTPSTLERQVAMTRSANSGARFCCQSTFNWSARLN
eukprot:4663486-Amphidinium_carterae.1